MYGSIYVSRFLRVKRGLNDGKNKRLDETCNNRVNTSVDNRKPTTREGELKMKITEIKEIARQRSVKIGKASKSELIRSIQLAEGNQHCFASGLSRECGQHNCAWREDCD